MEHGTAVGGYQFCAARSSKDTQHKGYIESGISSSLFRVSRYVLEKNHCTFFLNEIHSYAGKTGTGTRAHRDADKSGAWNLIIVGPGWKLWLFIEPEEIGRIEQLLSESSKMSRNC